MIKDFLSLSYIYISANMLRYIGGEICAYIFHSSHLLPWKQIIIELWPLSKKWRSRGERKKKKENVVFLYIIYYRPGRLPSSAGRWILRNKDGNCILYFFRSMYHAWYYLPCRRTFHKGECLALLIQVNFCNSTSKLYPLLVVVEKFVCLMLQIRQINPSTYYNDYMDTYYSKCLQKICQRNLLNGMGSYPFY